MEGDWVGCSLLDCDCFFLYFSIFLRIVIVISFIWVYSEER